MRQQRGTPSLRTLLYMDEIFGFFPATSNPPSKKPMLILLKQARAYGVGVVLATQNPVDLDYKGLYNEEVIFEPKILLKGKIRFYSESKGIDVQEEVFLKLPINESTTEINFEKCIPINDDISLYDAKYPENTKFYPLPFFIEEMKDFKTVENEFKDSLSRTKET